MHETHASNLNVLRFRFVCFSKYVPVRNSMYRVHTKYIPGSDLVYGGTYLKRFGIPSTRKYKLSWHSAILVCTMLWYHTTLYCSVAVYTGTYLLVMHLTILAISTFWFGTEYIWICTAQFNVQIQLYWVPNQNVEIARIMRCITRRYVQLQSSTRWYGTIA